MKVGTVPRNVTKLNSRAQLVDCAVLTKYPMMGDNTVTNSGATPITNPAMYTGTLYRCACCHRNKKKRITNIQTQPYYID